MANRIQTLYLAVGGKYRRRRILQNHPEPTTLRNVRDQQLHTLSGAPIFPKSRQPTALTSFEELVEVGPPPPMEVPEHQMMLCEDNNLWPVSCDSRGPTEDEQLNQMEDIYQEYYQAAEADVSKKSTGSGADKVLIASAVTSIGLMLVIGMIVAVKVLGEQAEPVAAAAVAVWGWV